MMSIFFCVALDIIIYPAPHSAPSRGEGVFGKDAEIRTHQALHEAKLSECPKGDRDREFAIFLKNKFFYNLRRIPACLRTFYHQTLLPISRYTLVYLIMTENYYVSLIEL